MQVYPTDAATNERRAMRLMSAGPMAALLAAAALAVRAAGCGAAPPAAARVCRASTRRPRSWWSRRIRTMRRCVVPASSSASCAQAGARAWCGSRAAMLRARPAADREEPVREAGEGARPGRKTHARSAHRDCTTGRVRRRAAVPGYPDRGVLRLLTDHRATPYTSGFTAAAASPTPPRCFRAILTPVRVSSATSPRCSSAYIRR